MRPETGSPHAWLYFAEGDLKLADVDAAGNIPPELLCFHCQQAAEKALKAVLVAYDIEPPRTHSLEALAALLPEHERAFVIELDPAHLSPYATTARYPGEVEPITDGELTEARRIARSVLLWATHVVERLLRTEP